MRPFYRRKPQAMSAAVSMLTTMPSFTASRGPDPVPRKIEDRGLAIEPIVGIRAFQLDLDVDMTPTLVSFNNIAWPARQPLYGYCLNNLLADHDVPGEDCVCGIYAWNKDNQQMLNGADVTGEVYLWGDVLVAELGYRAEIAYPKSLTIKAKPTRNVMRIHDGLVEAYGVPVMLVDHEETAPPELATYYGQTGATYPVTASGGFVAPMTPYYWTPSIHPPIPPPTAGS